MAFRARKHEVSVIDNYFRRTIPKQCDSDALVPAPLLPERAALFERITGNAIEVFVGDCCNFDFLSRTVQAWSPDVIVHFAEQPSAPYSMAGQSDVRGQPDRHIQCNLVGIAARPRLPHHQIGYDGRIWDAEHRHRRGLDRDRAQREARQISIPAPARQSLSRNESAVHRPAVVLRARLWPSRDRPDVGPGIWIIDRRGRLASA